MNIISARAATALRLLASGMPKKQLADEMNISTRGLAYTLHQAKAETNCKTTYQLVAEYAAGSFAVKEVK